jgi:hypothetical protein
MNVPQMAPLWVALAAALNRIAAMEGVTWNTDKVTSVGAPSTRTNVLSDRPSDKGSVLSRLWALVKRPVHFVRIFCLDSGSLGKERRSKLVQAVFERAGSVKVMFTNGQGLPKRPSAADELGSVATQLAQGFATR